MGILALDDGLQITQPVAHFPGDAGIGDVIEDGLVVFVDQHDDTLTGFLVGMADKAGKTPGDTQSLRWL